MWLYSLIFYLLAAVILSSTLLAITRRNLVHMVIYLIISFFGTGLLFFLLGAPLLAALEVIIYAGAIMVLFLFIIMTTPSEGDQEKLKGEDPTCQSCGPIRLLHTGLPILLATTLLVVAGLFIFADPEIRVALNPAMASPAVFGRFLFERYWFPVEVASFLLFVGLVGAWYLGRDGLGAGSMARVPQSEEAESENRGEA